MTVTISQFAVTAISQLRALRTWRRRAVRWAYERWEIGRSFPAQCGPFNLRCEPESAEVAVDAIQNVVSALALIQQVDPRWYSRLTRQMPSFLIKRGAGARYWTVSRICVLEVRTVLNVPAFYVASTIVHEAVHARIHARGISYSEIPERIERACVRSQIRFARRLGRAGYDVASMVAHYESLLQGKILDSDAREAWNQRVWEAHVDPDNPPPEWMMKALRRVFGP